MPQDHTETPSPTATWVVDGLEGHLARIEVEDGETLELPLASLPEGVKEGDVLLMFEDGGDFTLEIDHAETARRRTAGQAQLDTLNQAAPAGEIDL